MRSREVEEFDAVFDSQRVFRCLLQAASRPGTLYTLPPLTLSPLEAVARTLLDHEVTFCVLGGSAAETEERLSRLTGARVSSARDADFALISAIPGGDSAGAILELGRGTLERPERGATAIYAVEGISGSGPLSLELSGPGVPGTRRLGIAGMAAQEIAAIRETRQDYPLGVDVYLTDGAGRVAGLPRSTRLEVSA